MSASQVGGYFSETSWIRLPQVSSKIATTAAHCISGLVGAGPAAPSYGSMFRNWNCTRTESSPYGRTNVVSLLFHVLGTR